MNSKDICCLLNMKSQGWLNGSVISLSILGLTIIRVLALLPHVCYLLVTRWRLLLQLHERKEGAEEKGFFMSFYPDFLLILSGHN